MRAWISTKRKLQVSLSRGRCHLAALEKNLSGFVLSVFSETSSRASGNPLSNSALTATCTPSRCSDGRKHLGRIKKASCQSREVRQRQLRARQELCPDRGKGCFFKRFTYFMYTLFCLHVCSDHKRVSDGVWDCTYRWLCWGWSLGPLEEQLVLSTTGHPSSPSCECERGTSRSVVEAHGSSLHPCLAGSQPLSKASKLSMLPVHRSLSGHIFY